MKLHFQPVHCLHSTEPKVLPNSGVLAGLVRAQELYCEDHFGNKHEKGGDKKFASHLQWSEVVIAPAGDPQFSWKIRTKDFAGWPDARCISSFKKADGSYAQVLRKQGDVGTLERFAVLKEITKDHFNVTALDRRYTAVLQALDDLVDAVGLKAA